MEQMDEIEFLCHNNINMHLITTESRHILSMPRLDGCIDLQNVIISKSQ